jgi:hypothetical protein
MPIRFSGTIPVYTTLRATSSAALRGDIDAAVLSVGWVHTSTLTNGFTYTLTSPQGLACNCRIQDTGATEGTPLGTTENYLEVQFSGAGTSTTTGVVHRLIYSSTNTSYTGGYQLIAGVCQMFLSMPGVSNQIMTGGHRANTVSGGIPAITDDVSSACTVSGAPLITENWWSCGISKNGDQCLRTGRYFRNNYSYCLNGVVYNKDVTSSNDLDNYESMPLQLLPLTATQNIDFFAYVYPRVVKYNDDTPLVIDALLGFHWKIVGQIWDAFQKSRDTTLDELVTSTELDSLGNPYTATWQAFNYGIPDENKGGSGTWFATLYLLRSLPITALGNYAY